MFQTPDREEHPHFLLLRWSRWGASLGCFLARGTQVSVPLLVFSIHAEQSSVLWQAHAHSRSDLNALSDSATGVSAFVQINFSWPCPLGLTSFSRLRFLHMRLGRRRSLQTFTPKPPNSPKVSDWTPGPRRKAGPLRHSTSHPIGASNTGLRYAAGRTSLGPTPWDGGRRTTEKAI